MHEDSCEPSPTPPLQPKSDVSDFGQLIKRPNSGKPEFGRKRGREQTEFAACASLIAREDLRRAGRGRLRLQCLSPGRHARRERRVEAPTPPRSFSKAQWCR